MRLLIPYQKGVEAFVSVEKNENKRTKQARESKARILEGYMQLWEERGDNFTVQELCQHLNISIGRFYHHFKSKSDVFFELYCIPEDEFEGWLSKIVELDSRSKVIEYAVFFAGYHKRKGISFAQRAFSGLNETLSQRKSTPSYFEMTARDFWEEYKLQDHYTSAEIARLIRIVTRGVIFDWAVHNGCYDIEEAMRASISNTLDGILVLAENKHLYYKDCGPL